MVTIIKPEPSNKCDWIAPERIYLNASGQVVKANDPTKETLLIAKGGRLPMDQARRYGLVYNDADSAKAETALGFAIPHQTESTAIGVEERQPQVVAEKPRVQGFGQKHKGKR